MLNQGLEARGWGQPNLCQGTANHGTDDTSNRKRGGYDPNPYSAFVQRYGGSLDDKATRKHARGPQASDGPARDQGRGRWCQGADQAPDLEDGEVYQVGELLREQSKHLACERL